MPRYTNGRTLEESISELQRELQIRTRCYPGWVRDGKLTRTDATDRAERLEAALGFLEASLAEHEQNKLDTLPAAAAA